jgi:2Fe-2S ferredoxin
MTTILVIGPAGKERNIEGTDGTSLMECLRDAGVDGIIALCGGVCSCATCHVFIDPDWMPAVGWPAEGELDLLKELDDRAETSRLSCQVIVEPRLNGLRLTVAPQN